MSRRSPITTHVLDLGSGLPAAGMAVILEQRSGDAWQRLAEGRTDADGRLIDWYQADTLAGIYRLTFATEAYYDAQGKACFYPEVCISFRLSDPGVHHHVPLLINRWGYSTYRGS